MAIQSIELTDQAAHKIFQLLKEENDFTFCLRVYIRGGGCSGFQYNFAFDKSIRNDDFVTKKTIYQAADKPFTVRVLVDPISLQYLNDAKIDYQYDLSGERFVVHNPNTKTTCGCGSSFAV